MIDTAKNVIDLFIQLFTIKERNKEKYFNNYIEPLYKDAELIANDYFGLFNELLSRLETEEEVYDIIKWIEERRMSFLLIRVKVRALLKVFDIQKEKSMNKFQKGVWGLMKGGLSFVEEGHSRMGEYGAMDHTVLDLLYAWSQQPISNNRARYLKNARQQLNAIERAWQDVAEGYAELKKQKLSLKY